MIEFTAQQRKDLRRLSAKDFSEQYGFSLVFVRAIQMLRDQDGWEWPNGQMGRQERQWREWEDRRFKNGGRVQEVRRRLDELNAERRRQLEEVRRKQKERRSRIRKEQGRKKRNLEARKALREEARAEREETRRWLEEVRRRQFWQESYRPPLRACVDHNHDHCVRKLRHRKCGCPCHVLMDLGEWKPREDVPLSLDRRNYGVSDFVRYGKEVCRRYREIEREQAVSVRQGVWGDIDGVDDDIEEQLDALDLIRVPGRRPDSEGHLLRKARKRQRRIHDMRKSTGLCPACGRNPPARVGYVLCKGCLDLRYP